MMSKKLVMFDLDGVLIDSRDNMKYAWEAVRSETKVSVEFEAPNGGTQCLSVYKVGQISIENSC